MTNPLPETHVALSIDIFDQTQHALVRKHLTIERLIADILREFAQELDLNRKYILLYEGRQLDPEVVVGDMNFSPDKALTFGYYEPVRMVGASAPAPTLTESTPAAATPPPTSGRLQAAVLREVETGQRFTLNADSTIIGRGGSGTSDHIDIDLSTMAEGRTVSRPHARVFTRNGAYYMEPLKDKRPAYVNREEVPYGQSRQLQVGDVLGIGRVELVFELV